MGERKSHFSFSSPASDLSRPGSVTFHLPLVSLKVKTREACLFCSCLIQWFLNLSTHQNSLEGFLTQSPRPTPRDSDSLGSGWGPGLCISDKSPRDVAMLCYCWSGGPIREALPTLSVLWSLPAGEEGAVQLEPLPPLTSTTGPALPLNTFFCSIYWPQAVWLVAFLPLLP